MVNQPKRDHDTEGAKENVQQYKNLIKRDTADSPGHPVRDEANDIVAIMKCKTIEISAGDDVCVYD